MIDEDLDENVDESIQHYAGRKENHPIWEDL